MGGTHSVLVAGGGVNVAAFTLSDGGYSFTGGSIVASSLDDTAASGINRIANDMVVAGALTKSGGATLELSGSNSFGSIELSGGRLIAASSQALGEAEVAFSGGAELFVANDAVVENSLRGGNYIIGAEDGQNGRFSGAASATLLESGFTKVGAGRVEMVNEGYSNAAAMVINEGTLAYDAGHSKGLTSVSGAGTFELTGGMLEVNINQFLIEKTFLNGGSLKVISSLANRTFELGEESTLTMGFGCNLSNSQLLLHRDATFELGNSTFSGSAVVEDGATIATGTWGSPIVSASINGTGTLKMVHISGNQSTFSGVIADGEGGALALDSTHGNIWLSGNNTYSGGTTIASGTLTAANSSALGTGMVTLEGGTLCLASDLTINGLSGTAGKVDVGNYSLTVQLSGDDSTYSGGLTGTGKLLLEGTGSLQLDGAEFNELTGKLVEGSSLLTLGSLKVASGSLSVTGLAISDTLHVNTGAGASLHVDYLSLGAGATLYYSSLSDYATFGIDADSFAAAGFHLGFSEDVLTYLTTAEADGSYRAYDLGCDLEAYKGLVRVDGLDQSMYSIGFDEQSGHSTFQLMEGNSWTAEFYEVSWDANWGADTLAEAPARAWHATPEATTAFYGSKVDDGERIVVSVEGTGDQVIDLYATVNSDTDKTGGTLHRDTWVEVKEGSFGVIAGIYNNNWQSNAGPVWNLEGDVHLMMHGGSADYVIGFNHKDAKAPHHVGDSWISIGPDAVVHDSVIGGGVIRHNGGTTLTGNTNVFVYSMLTENGAIAGSDTIGRRPNAIIGGHSYGSNPARLLTLDGSSRVVVDVSGYEGAEASFVKTIIGGHDSQGCDGTITGSTSLSVDGNALTLFSENIIAGSRSTGGTELIEGNSTLTLSGGTFNGGSAKYLTGGSLVTGGTSTISGTASVIFTGGTINRDVYAAGISGGGSSTVGATRVEVGAGASFGTALLSGGFSHAANGRVSGDRTLALADGASLGSGVTLKDFSHVNVAAGTATLNTKGISGTMEKTGSGTLSYGGTGAIGFSLAEGTLALGADVSLATLSGVVGTTLDFAGHRLTLEQAGETTFSGSLSGAGSLVKTGAGSLTLDAAQLFLGSLEVQSGALTVSYALTISGSLAVNIAEGASLSINCLSLGEGATLLYTGSTGYATVGSFSVAGGYVLNLDAVRDYLTTENKGIFNTYDLGLNLGESVGQASVAGLEQGGFTIGTNEAGHSTITLTDSSSWIADYSAVAWDAKWGNTTLASQPERVWHRALDATTTLLGSKYDDGERTALSVSGTTGSIDLYALVSSASDASGGTLERDAWLEVTGGTFGTIAATYNGNGAAWNVKGDTHLMVMGGNVDRIIGFNDAASAQVSHEGSSWITVGQGVVVNDSIIGAGNAENQQDASLKGNTHIFVDGVLSQNGTLNSNLGSGATFRRYNAIIGGFARTNGYGITLSLDGSTNVAVDVSGYTGDAVNFVKSIYGGHVGDTYSHIGTITGNTNVSIKANGLVSFTENIVAGSFKGGSEADRADRIHGNTTLTIDGGVFAGGSGKYLSAGSLVTGGTSEIGGTAGLSISGGTINRSMVAAGVSTGGSSTVADSSLTLGDATYASDKYYAAGYRVSGGSATISGDSTLTVDGASVGGDNSAFLTGGSWVTGGSSSIAGTASVILKSGTINRSIFTAGISGGADNSSIVGATRLEIGAGVKIGDSSNAVKLSGGFTSSSKGSVLGARTLALHDGVDMGRDVNATLENFSHFEVAEGSASINAAKFVKISSITKTGAGELVLGGSMPVQAVTIEGGTLELGSSYSFSSLSGAEGTVLEILGNNLTINQAGVTTYGGSLIGTGTLEKRGAGTLSLTGSGNSLGSLSVTSGNLNVESISLSDSLLVNQAGLSIGSLHVGEGAPLSYTGTAGLASVERISAESSNEQKH